MIEVRGLEKSFGDHHVLQGIDLTIQDGETVAIIGTSGCGKSVLIKHIIGLLKPDKGSVLVDGLDVARAKDVELYKLRSRVGFLFQGAALFDSMTVAENISLGLFERGLRDEKKLAEIVHGKLKAVGLHGIEDRKPAELSGGMKKRV